MTPRPDRYWCWTCGWSTWAYARMERHLDAEHGGHGRIAMTPQELRP